MLDIYNWCNENKYLINGNDNTIRPKPDGHYCLMGDWSCEVGTEKVWVTCNNETLRVIWWLGSGFGDPYFQTYKHIPDGYHSKATEKFIIDYIQNKLYSIKKIKRDVVLGGFLGE
jgi:hypothetical protein